MQSIPPEPEVPSSRLLYASSLLVASGLVAGVLGYVFQITMAQLLKNNEFSLFSTFNALQFILGSPLAALVMLLARRTALLRVDHKSQEILALYNFWQKCIVCCFVFFAFFIFFLTPNLKIWLRCSNTLDIWLFYLGLGFSCLILTNIGIIQGLQRYTWLSALSIVVVFFKLIFCCILISTMQLGVTGALIGILISTSLTWLVGFYLLTRTLSPNKRKNEEIRVTFSWNDFLPVIIANVGFILCTQMDVPIVNYFFESKTSGSFSAAAILGKAILFLPTGIATALFPMVAAEGDSEGPGNRLLWQSILFTAALTLSTATLYYFYAEQICELLFGNKYPLAGSYLQPYGFMMIPFTLLFVFKNYFIAKGSSLFPCLLGLTSCLALLLMVVWPKQPFDIIAILFLLGWLLVISCVFIERLKFS